MTESKPNIEVGTIFETSYGTGPYEIIHVSEWCSCVEYVEHLSGSQNISFPHVHITCKKEGDREPYYVNGYTEINDEWVNVWQGDKLIIHGVKPGSQFELF